MAVTLARMRKFLVVAALGVLEAAAYVAADPRDLPAWVVTGALAVNAAGVYFVRNRPPPSAEALLARRVREAQQAKAPPFEAP
jgi:hypothetical protein